MEQATKEGIESSVPFLSFNSPEYGWSFYKIIDLSGSLCYNHKMDRDLTKQTGSLTGPTKEIIKNKSI